MIRVRRALISVFDKTGIVPFAMLLHKQGVELVSTGGTYELLKKEGLPVRSVSEVTGFPEMLDGRVKTLHPAIHGGVLYIRGNKSHESAIRKHGIEPIDMVIVNLYPFTKVIQKKRVVFQEAIENIDIGGPTMLRSAAKNFESVAVVCDPADYERIGKALQSKKGVSLPLLKELATKVFAHTSSYDAAITQFLSQKNTELPARITLGYTQSIPLRYGENPHQAAAFYQRMGVDKPFTQLQGKEISYNNLLDMYAALHIMSEYQEPAAAVIKHTNPCGIAQADSIVGALRKAIASDPLSAFGGIVVVNRTVDQHAAATVLEELAFFEVIIAPHFSEEALALFPQRKNLRVIQVPGMRELVSRERFVYTSVPQGLLVQEGDKAVDTYIKELRKTMKVVSKKKPTKNDIEELLFAWKCAKTVKSNAIVIARDMATVGIGAGQMSRVDSMHIACQKAGNKAQNAYVASDGFFPKADNIYVAAKAGVRAIIQPGGSIKDAEVIEAIDKHKLIMVCTGKRHFRH